MIYFAGIADQSDTAEDAIEFFKSIVATLPSDELSKLNGEFRSGLEGQEERILIVSAPGDADYGIIQDELGNDTCVFLTMDMWRDILKFMNNIEKRRQRSEKLRTRDWSFLNDIINLVVGREIDLHQRMEALRNGAKALIANKEARNQFIDGLIREQNSAGITVGQEDWVKIRDAVFDKHRDWLKGKGKELMTSTELKRAYRRERPSYNEICKKPWKKGQPPK